MAGSVNKAIIVGNLGADPDVRTTQSGQMVATLSIATSDSFTDKQGQRQERTEWHRVVVWGKLAELAQRYLAKGRKVYVEGRIQTRKWTDQNTGQDRYSTEVVARELTFLDSGKGQQGQGQGQGGGYGAPQSAPQGSSGYGGGYAPQRAAPQQQGGPQAPQGGYGDIPIDDDLPF